MASAATVSLIVIVLGVLVFAGLGLGIVLWITGGRARGGEMSCGGCGYAVRGLEQFQCPECGADLRAVGIHAGGPGGSGGRRVTGIALTVFCGLSLLSCGGMMVFGLFMSGARSTSQPALGPVQTHTQPIPTRPNPAPAPGTAHDSAESGDLDDGGAEDEDETDGENPF